MDAMPSPSWPQSLMGGKGDMGEKKHVWYVTILISVKCSGVIHGLRSLRRMRALPALGPARLRYVPSAGLTPPVRDVTLLNSVTLDPS